MSADGPYRQLRAFWPLLPRRRRRQASAAVALAVLAAAVEFLTLALSVPWLGAILNPARADMTGLPWRLWNAVAPGAEPRRYLLLLTLAFGGAALANGVLRMAVIWVQTRLAYAIGADLSNLAFRRALAQPYDVQVGRDAGATVSVFTYQVELVTRSAILPAFALASGALVVAAILAAVAALTGPVAPLLFLALGAAYALVVLATRRLLARDSEAVARGHTSLVAAVSDSLGGVRDIIVHGQQRAVAARIAAIDRRLRTAVAHAQALAVAPRFGIEAFSTALLAGFAYLALTYSPSSAAMLPTLGLIVLAVQRLMPTAQSLFAGYIALRSSSASSAKLLDLLALPPAAPTAPVPPLPFDTALTLERVSYTYPGRTQPALRDVSLAIPRGARVAITGPTGAGKSTLVDVMLGLLSPSDGAVLVDGERLAGDAARGWQAQVAHVPQAIFLVDGSIAQNIALGVPADEVDTARLDWAARTALVLDGAFPAGLDTRVGDNGALLSGGQRQRIGMARALYRGGAVLFLDEATNALDAETEARVLAALADLPERPTLIVIGHRDSAITGCDHLVRLAGDGTALIQRVAGGGEGR